MPLHGKVVVLKRSGGDGTEFPLTSTCTFGRKPDCDIRIQIPQVSKEHCRIDLNENKEVILTNLSSVNPTQVNGQALQQPERLKHGDVITIIDRSFRFEYPPPPTPKKRASVGGKAEVTASDPHLKDAANTDNIQRSLEKPQEAESKEEASSLEGKTASPFSDLYQMIKQSLDVKTPRKSSISVLQAQSSKFCTPQVPSARKGNRRPVEEKGTPRQPAVEPQTSDVVLPATPKSTKKRCSTQLSSELTPQKFTVGEALEQISQPQRSPLRRRSKETKSPASEKKKVKSPAKKESAGAKSSEKGKKRKSEELGSDLPTQQMKRKRVSFGTQLSPELFDKRLPPDSPLRKGAAPRRSLSLYKPKQSLLRRASVIGLIKEHQSPKAKSPAKKKSPSPKKTSSAKSASPKVQSPARKAQSPKAKTPSPGKKSATPTKSSPKAKSPAQTPKSNVTPKKASPKAATTPKKASPKAATTPKKASPKAATTPKKASPKAATTPKKASPKAATTPKKASPKAATTPKAASPKAATTPKAASPKAATTPKAASPKAATTPKKASPKAATTPKKASPKQTKTQTPRKALPTPSSRSQTPAKSPVQRKPDSSTKPPRKSGTESLATPLSADQTPKVQGRFSVSRITTPSPVSEDLATASCPSAMVTPKIPLRRKSMKSSTAKKTPALKSAARLMRRKSTMRTSMKVMASWADIVRFGKTKVQTAVPTKSQVTKKITKKKAVAKPQTPKRRLPDHVGTGHAASPATIVVGRAHRLVHPTGAPPKIVTNTAVLRKNLKMDEDLTGISDMFQTPKNEKRMSTKVVRSAKRTPLADIDQSQMEPSVLNTPEETGEMVVSPMSVASTMKGRRYNSEAVQRLLNDDIPSLDVQPESTEKAVPATPTPQMTEAKTGKITPTQKAESVKELNLVKTPQPECLSAVKRIMKTPQEKVEPVEDLGGKLLRTPRQRLVPQEECLTGVKRIMETPAENSPPAEDLSGELLKTPPQKIDEPECLSAVKTSMKTPDQEVDQLECVSRSPQQKPEQQECLTGVKRIMKTPKEKYEPIDDIRGKLLQTPKQKVQQQEECLTGVKRIMKTPRERLPPVEKNFGLKRLMQSPRLRGNAPVEDFEGLEELMREPVEEQIIGDAEVNIEQPQVSVQVEAEKAMSTEEVANQQNDTEISSAVVSVESSPKTKPVCGRRAKVIEHKVEEKDEVEVPVKTRRGRKVENSALRPTARGRNAKTPEESQERAEVATVEQSMVISAQEPLHNTVSTEPEQSPDPAVQEAEPSAALEEPVVKQRRTRKTKAAVTVQPAEAQESNATPLGDELQKDLTAKPARGRTTRAMDTDEGALAEAEEAKDKEDSVVVPIRGRRGKKTEAVAAVPAVKQTRGRAGRGLKHTEVAKEVLPEESEVPVTESKLEEVHASEPEPTIEMVLEKTKRGRKRIAPIEPESKVNADEGELSVVESKPAQTEQPLPTEKPTRGRRGKAQTVPLQPESESAVASLPAVVETMDIQVEQPRRGRRTKITVEPSPSEADVPTVEAQPVSETAPEKPAQAEKPKRGRKARPAENSHTEQEAVEDLPSEPKRMRRTRKVEDQGETVQTTEEAPVVEPVKAEQLAPKSRRGAQKPKEAKSSSTGMTEEATLLSVTEKPKRGRRGQETSAEIMEEDSVPTKSTRRPVVPAAPAKRVGRVAKVTPKESTSAVEEAPPEAGQVKPVKRGRGAAKAPAKEAKQEQPANEDSLKSKRSIKWNSDIEVIEVTPLRTVRGRKANGTQKNKVNNVPTNPEEEDLSDKSQPAKRPRRGVKAAVVEETTAAEVQPKPRRGRLAKK
ncbi:unnamed protein product [Knipowitschia caucasica]